MRPNVLITLVLMLSFSVGLNAQQNGNRRVKPKPKQPAKQVVMEVPLPARCSDCFFAAPLEIDVPFGPTEPLRGYGFVNEIRRDATVKNVFEVEHNSVWYYVDVPYAGKLCVDVTPRSISDDYDMLVYKYTDKYFCNRVERNRVLPLRSVLSSINTEQGGKLGLDVKASQMHIDKNSIIPYAKSIDVKPNERYIIVLDNLTDGGLGHTIKVSINTNFASLAILPIDSLNRERTTANFYVKEDGTERVVLDRPDVGAQKIKLLPNKTYAISIKKEGYFNYFKEVSHAQALKDSILTARLIEIKVGAALPLKDDIYYDVDEEGNVSILPDSYPALDYVVETLQEYPKISIDIIGRISTDGLNLKSDIALSLKRAEAIKNYLIGKGIPETNIRARGSSAKELEMQILEQKKKNTLISPRPEIRITKTK